MLSSSRKFFVSVSVMLAPFAYVSMAVTSSEPRESAPSAAVALNSLSAYQSLYGIWFCMVMIWMNWFESVELMSSNAL